jgi:hypothetical protein
MPKTSLFFMFCKTFSVAPWRSFLLSFVFITPLFHESYAQSYKAVGVARASEGLIKAYDPKVRNVRLVVPAKAGTPTACKKDNVSTNGDWEAFYCRLDRSILISQNNLDLIERKYGLAAISTLVAHEFAHGRQHAISGFMSDAVWTVVFDELQADCIAGVYMRRASPIPLSKSQIAQSKGFLESIGDYSVQEKSWHGTPGMRGAAFQFGYNKGNLDACWASGERNWKKTLNDAPDQVERAIENAPVIIDNLIDRGLNFLDGL